MHDVMRGPGTMAIHLIHGVGPPHDVERGAYFGDTVAIDDLVTEEPDAGARAVGRAQGTYMLGSQHEEVLAVAVTVVLTAGPYNFAAILAKGYHNADFLLNQVVPLRGSIATAGTGIPLDSPTINVGTEYFPFLMALGPAGAVAAMLGLYAMLVWSARRLRASTSLFSLLIFLRMAYVAAMAPFAPQAYTFMSAGFIALCLLMQLFAAWLPQRPVPFPLPRVDHHAP